jgi:hypothetical protein
MNQYETPVEQPPEPKDEKKWHWYDCISTFFGFMLLYVLVCLAWAGLIPILEQQGVTIPEQLDMRHSIQKAIDWVKSL